VGGGTGKKKGRQKGVHGGSSHLSGGKGKNLGEPQTKKKTLRGWWADRNGSRRKRRQKVVKVGPGGKTRGQTAFPGRRKIQKGGSGIGRKVGKFPGERGVVPTMWGKSKRETGSLSMGRKRGGKGKVPELPRPSS